MSLLHIAAKLAGTNPSQKYVCQIEAIKVQKLNLICRSMFHEKITYLVRLGMNPNNKKPSNEATPLHEAAFRGDEDTATLLITLHAGRYFIFNLFLVNFW